MTSTPSTPSAQASSAKSVKGRSFMVTGANTGIGRATAHALAKAGGKVFLACRSIPKAEAVAEEIREETGNSDVHVHSLDLASLDKVRASAKEFLDSGEKLDVLVNNAGLAGHHGLTEDGFEIAFGTNHLGPMLFTLELLPRLLESERARVVMVSSQNHRTAKSGIDYDLVRKKTKSFTGLREYGVSKLANVLFAKELARRVDSKKLQTYSLHPGQVASDIWRKVPWPIDKIMKRKMLTNEDGAKTSVMCAMDPALDGVTGLYYDDCKEREPSRNSKDEALAKELWEKSCDLLGIEDKWPRVVEAA